MRYAGIPTIALWIGSDHELVAAGTGGPELSEQVLIWETGGIQYRLEGELPLDRMTELAQEVQGGTELLRPG